MKKRIVLGLIITAIVVPFTYALDVGMDLTNEEVVMLVGSTDSYGTPGQVLNVGSAATIVTLPDNSGTSPVELGGAALTLDLGSQWILDGANYTGSFNVGEQFVLANYGSFNGWERNIRIRNFHTMPANRDLELVITGTSLYYEVVAQTAAAGPNIIIVNTDDMAAGHFFGYEGRSCLTPTIDSLAYNGINFTESYSVSTVCGPSRYALMTGRYASRNTSPNLESIYPPGTLARFGVSDTELEDDGENIGAWLQQAGYRTGLVGKAHLIDDELLDPSNWAAKGLITYDSAADPKNNATVNGAMKHNHRVNVQYMREMGFDFVGGLYRANLLELHSDALNYHNQEWVTKNALDFIEENHNQSFFLYMAPTINHGPIRNDLGRSLLADPRYTGEGYLPSEDYSFMPSRTAIINEVNAAGKVLKSARETWVDYSMQAILNKLAEHGIENDTLIIFTSDHGFDTILDTPVVQAKSSLFDPGMHVPLIMHWPNGIANPGRTYNELVQNIDFVPTILELAGVSDLPTRKVDGLSLVSVLNGSSAPVRDEVFSEIGYARGVRTKDWKYIAVRYTPTIYAQIDANYRWEDYVTKQDTLLRPYYVNNASLGSQAAAWFPHYFDDDQLYDMNADPGEQTNLASQYPEKIYEFKQRLSSHIGDIPNRPFRQFSDGSTEFSPAPPSSPGEPTNVQINYPTSTTADLTWDDNSNSELGYIVEQSVSGGPYEIIFEGGVDTTSASVSIPAGSANTELRVSAYNVVVANNSTFVSQTIPTSMEVNETQSVQVVFKNTGLDTWTTAAGHNLGSQNPQDNTTWTGSNRVTLSGPVAPDENAIFDFNITAPAQAGLYNFQWGMVDDVMPNQEWFGPKTPNVLINVGNLYDMTSDPGTITDNGVNPPASQTSAEAIDDNIYTKFLSFSNSAYLQYQLTSPTLPVVAYSLTSANDVPERDPVDVVLKGSHDGTNWDTLDTQTGIVYASRFTKVVFNVSNSTVYEYYRLEMANGGAVSIVQVAEIELLGPGNSPPQVTSTPDLYAEVSTTYNYTLTAMDPVSDPITFLEDSTPDWLTFTPATGLLTGAPSTGDIGPNLVQLDVTDGINTIHHDFTITVSAAGNDAPVITSTPVTGVIENDLYSYTLTATDADGDPLTYIGITIPSGFTFVDGVLSGSTAVTGLHAVKLTVSDGTVSVDQEFNIMVFTTPVAGENLVLNPSFELGGAAPSNWTRNSTYASGSQDTSFDGDWALKLSIDGPMNITKTYQDIPIEFGETYDLSVKINASAMTAGNVVFDTNDEYDPSGQFVVESANGGWTEYSGSFTATDTDIQLRMFASDTFDGTAYFDDIVLAVSGATGNIAPAITSIPVTNVDENAAYSYTLLAADAEGDPLTFNGDTIPAGLTFDAPSGLLTSTGLSSGDYDVQISVSDGQGGSDVQNFTISVTSSQTGYEAWAATEGVSSGNLTNLLEYALDGDTTTYGDSEPTLMKVSGELKYIHNQRSDDPNLIYTVETSSDLTANDWAPAGVTAVTNITGTEYNVVTNAIPTTASRSYIRLKIINQ